MAVAPLVVSYLSEMNPAQPLVHLVNGDAAVRHAISLFLGVSGYAVMPFEDTESCLVECRTVRPPQYLIVDLEIPNLDGLALVDAIAHLQPAPRCVALTGRPDSPMAHRLAARGVTVLEKPFNADELLAALGRKG